MLANAHPPRQIRRKLYPLAALGLALTAACFWRHPLTNLDAPTVTGSPPLLRVAAEWEPAAGVLVSWPPYLPSALFVELAKDTQLHVLYQGEADRADAVKWFGEWGIARESVTFIELPTSDDAGWPRDFGPLPVFTAEGELHLGDARYDKSTPDSGLACDAPLQTPWDGGWGPQFLDYDIQHEDAAPTAIAAALELPALDIPLVVTGGNFLTDGRGGALATCILVNENRSNGISEEAFRDQLRERLGIHRFQVVPNFEDDGIQHIDCLLKLLDEERLLVARPPADHPLSERYERIVTDHLSKLRAASGEHYEILRIDTAPYAGERLAAYTNSLILNDVVYVPLFGIPADARALEQWQAALPGHTIKGFPFVLADEPALRERVHRIYPDGIGWRDFDALHCRTRAVWDPEMLHIAVDQSALPKVSARIVSYGAKTLMEREVELHWRPVGSSEWQTSILDRNWMGTFDNKLPTDRGELEFYVEATDVRERTEAAPRTAPAATYRFKPDH